MKKNIKIFFKISVSVGILVFLFWKLNINMTAFNSIHNWCFIWMAAILPISIIPFVSTNRWKVFLSQVGIDEPWWVLWKINFVSMFQGIILPSSQGFDALRIFYIEKRHPEARGRAGSTILIERMIGFIVLCLISMIASIFITIPNKKEIIFIISSISIALLFLCMLFTNKKLYNRYAGRTYKNKYLSIMFGYFDKLFESLTTFPYKKIVFSSIVLIVLFQISTITSVFLIFNAYGIDLPFYIHLSIYPIISIISIIPITISGFGIREGFFVYFYSFLGVPPEIAVVVSIMNYVVLTLEPALLGGVIYLFDTITNRK